MSNLIVFGDSFSTHFTTNNSVLLEESWPVLLSEKLNLNLINNALPGACNGEITNEIFKKYNDINDNDIVIIEIGFFNRILEQFSGTTFMLGYNDDRFDELDFNFYSRKILNMDSYIMQDFIKFEFICEYLKRRNIKFLVWCIDDIVDPKDNPKAHNRFFKYFYDKFNANFIKFNREFGLMTNIVEKNPQFWVNNSDKHFNKLGHEYFFLYLYDIIIGKERKNII